VRIVQRLRVKKSDGTPEGYARTRGMEVGAIRATPFGKPQAVRPRDPSEVLLDVHT
jgi:hypothetical protein